MNDSRIQEARKKLGEINKIVSRLDPAIRAAAFGILAPLYFENVPVPAEQRKDKEERKVQRVPPPTGDRDEFFNSFEHEKTFENVYLISAWLYSQYGVFPIETNVLREVAGDIGLTIPDRPDATMRAAKHKGKNLYRKKSGGYQPTVNGERFFKETYGVGKGTKPRPTEENE